MFDVERVKGMMTPYDDPEKPDAKASFIVGMMCGIIDWHLGENEMYFFGRFCDMMESGVPLRKNVDKLTNEILVKAFRTHVDEEKETALFLLKNMYDEYHAGIESLNYAEFAFYASFGYGRRREAMGQKIECQQIYAGE